MQYSSQVDPTVFRFLACPWETVGTGQLHKCVGICRTHRTAPRPRALAKKAVSVAFISILD